MDELDRYFIALNFLKTLFHICIYIILFKIFRSPESKASHKSLEILSPEEKIYC